MEDILDVRGVRGARIIGRRPEEVLELTYWDVTPRDYEAREQEILETIRATGRFGPYEKEYLHRDGHRVPIVINGMLVHSAEGDHVWGIIEDITERKQAERALTSALEHERELSQLKSGFVSMVSHEFRTPLGIIQSSAEILDDYLDQLEPAERREQLHSIIKNSRRMAGLMEEVLVLGRLDAGRMHFQPAPLDLAALCRRLVDEVLSTTDAQCPIGFHTADLPAEVHADERLLRHILLNLLTNAVKYSEPGQPVAFRACAEAGGIGFTVEDHGIGIPDAEQAELFKAFHRGSNVGQRQGTGLGLVIVKRCVELHGGEIRIASGTGKGTTVKVLLPLSVEREGAES